MLAECVNCGFYVGSNEKFCPDCGVSAPDAPLKIDADDFDRPLMFKSAATIAIIIILGIVVFRLYEGNRDFSDLFGTLWLIVFISLILSVFAVLFLAHFLTKKEKRRRFAAAESATSFKFMQDTILLRNHELRIKLDDLRSSTKKGFRLSASREKSKAFAEKVETQNLIARYDLLNNKIDFARLQNKLLPLIEQRNARQRDDNFSEELDEIRSDLELVNLALTDEYAAKTPENFLSEKQDLLARVVETEKFCEALSKRRSNSEPFADDLETLPSDDLARRTNNFEVQAALRNFTDSFNEIEREHERWKTNRR